MSLKKLEVRMVETSYLSGHSTIVGEVKGWNDNNIIFE